MPLFLHMQIAGFLMTQLILKLILDLRNLGKQDPEPFCIKTVSENKVFC